MRGVLVLLKAAFCVWLCGVGQLTNSTAHSSTPKTTVTMVASFNVEVVDLLFIAIWVHASGK